MLVLRATMRALRHLPALPLLPPSTGQSTGALGDWYVNKVMLGRKPLLLLASANSLLPMLVPAALGKELPQLFPQLLRARLTRMGIAPALIEAEVATCTPVALGKTENRSVVGILVDFAKMMLYHETTDLHEHERHLEVTPCFAGTRHGFAPDFETPKRLAEKWGAPGATYVHAPQWVKH